MKTYKTILTTCVSGGLFLWTTFAFSQECQINQPPTTPDQRFIDNADGTITDTQTGLMWKKCLEGQRGPSCYGHAAQMPWEAAAQTAQLVSDDSFARKDGWRLPSIQELTSIVERNCRNPSINTNVFPNTPARSFWTASQSGANAWSLDFDIGRAFQSVHLGGKFVRLVRNAQ